MRYSTWYLTCQTCVLNLFQFHHSQNQTHFLFLLPNIAKLLDLSAELPPRLLPISKLLFKFPLVFMALLLLSYSMSSQALSAQTLQDIHGTAPYLTFDGGVTKANDISSLLGITLSDGTIIKANEDNSSTTSPIELPNALDTFETVQSMVPFPRSGNNNYPTINLNDVVNAPYNYGRDDDGDDGISATGSITVKWESKNANNAYEDITSIVKRNPNSLLNVCDAPYRLTISSSGGLLQTRSGVPDRIDFASGSHTYYINPNKAIVSVCYAQPNLAFGSTSNGMGLNVDGSTWVANKGYKVLSASNSGNYNGASSVTSNNFPSTGSHGLFFYLLLKNITPAQVLAANGNVVRAEEGGNVSLTLSTENTPRWQYKNYNNSGALGNAEPSLKITLKGPRYNSNNKSFTPVTFKLYADSSKTKLLYEFKIMRWYIAQPNVNYRGTGNGSNAQTQVSNYCASFGSGYRIPDVNDYTNANASRYGWRGGIPGRAENSARVGLPVRQLSYQESTTMWQGGLFNEWGCIVNNFDAEDLESVRCSGYPGSDWDIYIGYWSRSVGVNAGDSHRNGKGLGVHSALGFPYSYDFYNARAITRAVCVTP
ncbi:hypothetical protein [Gilliamella sp. BG2]|uniref:hypothetical protein n=1 Tax=Gilliamella sp. BG2 TaxID=3351509 RepID=UPI003985F5F9